ncbi:hypothetical protein ACIRON_02660 [Nocardioides sp. NPDC101246]|uniref:hypothetical protein n=1 Tax=Nocardioides sp. NPDC101246 TaxID=3364336 RepID=UPI00380D467C
MDLSTIVTSGGMVSGAAAAGYFAKLTYDGWRAGRTDQRTDRTSAVTDAATANATLVKAMETLERENVRMAKKILHLEEEAEIKDRKIDDLEDRLNGAVRQVAEIASELSDLKAGR